MNQEMVKAEKRFANHKARFDILDENVRVLNWRQPGTQAYAIRAVMDGYHVYITGDLGSAVICLTETATLKALSGYWKKPGYFMEKFVCTTDDYFFDYETAKGELRERKTMLLEEYRDNHPDMLANGETEYQDDLDERETDLLGSFNSEKGFAANPVAFSAWLEMDMDGVEFVPYMGRTIAHRIWLWLAAFKMAYEALQDTSTERYTQEYLDAIERNTPPRNGAPIGRDSFEWAGCAEELSVCNVAHLLAAAKRTPGYFQVRSALCGMPVIRERYADTMALLNKVKGTDAYDILAQLMQQAEREA